jgi:GNAT superfamily N-acetyltransferase
MDITVRKFETRDAAAVSTVIREAMRVTNSRDYPPSVLNPLMYYFSPKKVLQLSLERICLVAETDGEIVGTVALENDELETFFVHPDYQGKGVGRFLLQSVEEIAARGKIKTVRVLSSLSAVSFYEKAGYRKNGIELEESAGRQIGLEKTLETRLL